MYTYYILFDKVFRYKPDILEYYCIVSEWSGWLFSFNLNIDIIKKCTTEVTKEVADNFIMNDLFLYKL